MTTAGRTLVLMRHAKSAYPDNVGDQDRPLASRGLREAGLAGQWLRDNVSRIDQVLCSSALRTRETLRLTEIDAPVSYLDRLYGAAPGSMIAEINAVADTVTTLLVVGHEPTVSQVALGLASRTDSDPTAVRQISMKYPTSGIAVLEVSGTWSMLELGGAQLNTFHVPR
jgi:phosphohistidine phosphatase